MLQLLTRAPGAAPQAWKRICEASRREFQAIYDRLGVRLTERGESAYNPLLRPLVEELQERGIAEDSDGAKVPARRRSAAAEFMCCVVQWDASEHGPPRGCTPAPGARARLPQGVGQRDACRPVVLQLARVLSGGRGRGRLAGA
jgi:hypothetical protein